MYSGTKFKAPKHNLLYGIYFVKKIPAFQVFVNNATYEKKTLHSEFMLSAGSPYHLK